MLEVSYYKEFRCNYLIIKEAEKSPDSYQCKMITENTITGLLKCRERHIDGELLLYYDITSKQSLAGIYEDSYLKMNDIRNILHQLYQVKERMMGYLLVERCLLLNPEYIFMDAETKELFFLYFPFEREENSMITLVEFMTDRVDAHDTEAVELCYKILDLLEKERFALDEVLAWVGTDCEESASCEVPEKAEYIHGGVYDENEPVAEELSAVKGTVPLSSKVRKDEKIAVCFMLLMIAGGGGLYYVSRFYHLGEAEWVCFYAVLAIIVTLFVLSCLYLLGKKLLFGSGFLTGYRYEKVSDAADEDKLTYMSGSTYEEAGFREEKLQGDTVFVPWTESCENKLYGVGKGNKNHIDLSRLPITIGKLAGSVDMVISDQSLSRRHVKFFRDGNKICMADLNSTNGTFRNGLRMEPNTSEIIEPGDEIRLGKLKFIYR